jgi:polysaccharide pyruvyl transferase WcaK-like protein
MAKRVALIGATCWGNRGAEAMLATTIGVIRQRHPDAIFAVLSYYPERDAQLIRDSAVTVCDARPISLVLQHFPFALWLRLLKQVGVSWPKSLTPAAVVALAESDVLIDLGGISFADGRAVYLPFNILCIYPAMVLGVPVIKLAQAMGPFDQLVTRLAASLFLTRCRHVVARGRRTFAHLAEIGMPPDRFSLAADVSFGYRPDFSLSSENDNRVSAIVSGLQESRVTRVIGISPSTLVRAAFQSQHRDYVGLIAEVATRLVERGFQVVVLPNATRQGSLKPKNNDLVVIDELRRRLQQTWTTDQLDQLIWVDFDLNTFGVRRIVGCLDALVTSRFHAMIAALATHTPVLVVGWSHKYVEVLHEFGLTAYAADNTTTTEQVCATLDTLLQQSGSVRKQIAAVLPEMQASALRQFDIVERTLR